MRQRARVPGVIALSAGLAAAAIAADETVHLTMEIRTKDGTMPACTPVHVVADDNGRPVAVKAAQGRWPKTTLARGRSEGAEVFEKLEECVASAPQYTGRYDDEAMAMLRAGILSEGMPIEFAWMALGPPRAGSVNDTAHRWGEPPHAKEPPGIRNLSGKRAPIARLDKTIRTHVSTDANRRISRISADQLELESWPAVYCELARNAAVALPECHLPDEGGRETDRLEKRRQRRADFDAGMAAYDGGAHAAAFEYWLPLAGEGYARAQYSVADLYFQGEGVERDPVQGLRWLREAAEQDFSPAQYHLGFLLARGQDVARDPVEAYYWMTRAARLGNEEARASQEIFSSTMAPHELSEAKQRLEETEIELPRLAFRIEPVYPELARVARLEGAVVLQAVIHSDGTVGQIEVLRSNRPNMGFEPAAAEALRQWRYEPARRKGLPVAVYFSVIVEFTLH